MKNHILKIVPASVVASFCGVTSADIYPSGIVRLHNCDGTKTTAKFKRAEIHPDNVGFFTLCDLVKNHPTAKTK